MPINPDIILEATRDMPNLGETYVNALEAGRKASAENHKAERANKFASLQANIPQGVGRTQYLSSQGYPEEALAMDKIEAETGKLKAEGGIKDIERQEKIKAFGGKVFQYILGHPKPTREVVAQALDNAANNGEIPLELYQQSKAGLANMPSDPEEIRALARARVMELTAPKDQMQFVQPDANAQLGAQTQMRGQDITQQNNLANQGLNREEFGFNQNKFNKEYGLNQEQEEFRQANEMAKYRLDDWKAKNPQGGVSASQKRQDADAVLSILNQAAPLLEGSTHSLVGTGYDKAVNAFGVGTGGGDKAAQLKALEGALISKMPKMTGPQSDKDVLLYKQMAGQIGDSTLPISTRKAAMESIRTLNEQYASPENVGRGATGSWDDSAINAEAQKRGKSPEDIRAYLKARGMVQ